MFTLRKLFLLFRFFTLFTLVFEVFLSPQIPLVEDDYQDNDDRNRDYIKRQIPDKGYGKESFANNPFRFNRFDCPKTSIM